MAPSGPPRRAALLAAAWGVVAAAAAATGGGTAGASFVNLDVRRALDMTGQCVVTVVDIVAAAPAPLGAFGGGGGGDGGGDGGMHIPMGGGDYGGGADGGVYEFHVPDASHAAFVGAADGSGAPLQVVGPSGGGGGGGDGGMDNRMGGGGGGGGGGVYSVRIAPVAPPLGANVSLRLTWVHVHALRPLPTSVGQAEPALVVFEGDAYFGSPCVRAAAAGRGGGACNLSRIVE